MWLPPSRVSHRGRAGHTAAPLTLRPRSHLPGQQHTGDRLASPERDSGQPEDQLAASMEAAAVSQAGQSEAKEGARSPHCATPALGWTRHRHRHWHRHSTLPGSGPRAHPPRAGGAAHSWRLKPPADFPLCWGSAGTSRDGTRRDGFASSSAPPALSMNDPNPVQLRWANQHCPCPARGTFR